MIILPLLAFGLLAVYFITSAQTRPGLGEDWRGACLLAGSYWGVLIVLGSEVLGMFDLITTEGIRTYWLIVVALLTMAVVSRRLNWLGEIRRLRTVVGRIGSFEGLTIVAIASVVIILFAIAVLAPPNTMDALLYHIPRTLHWIQNASLEPYSTQYQAQLSYPIWSEMVVLNFRLLWPTDQLANLVQWTSMVGSLVGVSAIVSILGGGLRTQLLAVAFALSIPMGVLQATSSQTDHVVGFWLVTLSYFVFVSQKRDLTALERFGFGSALGLSMLTKATAYVIAFPLMIWYLAASVRNLRLKDALAGVLPIGLMAATINLGYWARNIAVFGSPFGPAELIAANTILSGPINAIRSYPVALVKTVLVNFVTPWQSVNALLLDAMQYTEGVFGAELVEYPIVWAWNYEDLAGNPLHIMLVAFILIAYATKKGSNADKRLKGFAIALVAGFLLYPLVLSYSSTQLGIRYQLPILLLASPLVAMLIASVYRLRIVLWVTIALVLSSIPWVLFNTSRPLIGMVREPEGLELNCFLDTLGCTRVGSVLEVGRRDLLFANRREIQDPAIALTNSIDTLQCQQVGLRLDSHDPEYPYWYLLEAPESGIRFESLNPVGELGKYGDPTIRPCAIICSICGERERLHGLDLFQVSGPLRLYAGDGFNRDPDA